MAKKKIVVERIGENSGQPITTTPVPVRRTFFMNNVPLTVYGNGTVVSSTVDKNGVNEQTFYKSNLAPSFMIRVKHDGVSEPDTLGVYRYRGENDIIAYDKLKPGSEQYKSTVEKSTQYGIPLATYGEAYNNLEEVKRQADKFQEGGQMPSNDQQQLFVSIITDMANVLGVEPSQELAEAVITAFENNDDSQGLITLFTQIKDKHMQETGLFREGGKMIAFVEKFGCGGKKAPKKTPKKQEGGVTDPTARQARQALMDEKGMSRGDARQLQRQLMRQNMGQGMSRGDARQLQRQLMRQNMGQGMSRGDARAVAAGRMSEMANASPVRAAIVGAASAPALNVQAPAMDANPQSLEANYDNFNFNTAFRRARQSGADTFKWRGKKYGTQLAGEGTRPAGGTGTRPGNRVDNWQNDFNRFVDGIQNVSRRTGDWVQDAGNRMFDAVQAGSNMLGLRPAVVDGAIDKVQGAANRVYDGAQEIGTKVVDGVQQGVNGVIDNTQAGVRRIGQGIANGAQRAGAWLTQFGQRFNQ